MSPRKSDPGKRPALIDVAARLLASEGPQSLSTRRIAAEAGSSTMAVYTHFGGMSGLIREIVHEGFERLQGYLTRVAETPDPVADIALLGRAYRHASLTNSHLYAVMFGGASLAGFSLDEEDRQYGRYTMVGVVQCAARCIETGRFADGDPMLIANQLWIATHGIVTLELGDYLIAPFDADRLFEAQLVAQMIGAGDTPEAATRSVTLSRTRFPQEVTDPTTPLTKHPFG